MAKTIIVYSPSKRPKDDDLIKIMWNTGGNVTEIAMACRTARGTVYNWIRESPLLQEEMYQIRQSHVDFAEKTMMKRIGGFKEKVAKVVVMETGAEVVDVEQYYPPDSDLIKFFLRTQAKDRGYIERKELTGLNGTALVEGITFNIIATKSPLMNELKNKQGDLPEHIEFK